MNWYKYSIDLFYLSKIASAGIIYYTKTPDLYFDWAFSFVSNNIDLNQDKEKFPLRITYFHIRDGKIIPVAHQYLENVDEAQSCFESWIGRKGQTATPQEFSKITGVRL